MRTYRAGLMADPVEMRRAATEAVRRDCMIREVREGVVSGVRLFKSHDSRRHTLISLSLTLFVISRRTTQDDSSFVRTKLVRESRTPLCCCSELQPNGPFRGHITTLFDSVEHVYTMIYVTGLSTNIYPYVNSYVSKTNIVGIRTYETLRARTK